LEAVILDRREAGEQKLQAAADLAHDIHDGWGEGYAHMMLAICAADAGDGERTRLHCTIALHTASLGPLLGVPLQQLARVTVEHNPARALRLMGSADGHLERTGTVEPPFLTSRAEAVRQRAAQLLGDRTAEQKLEEGRGMTLEEAIAFATAVPAAGPRNPGGLTQREMQVATLVGRRQTNREIARTLVISVRTAESHVEHILAKLGLSNRLELAAWARGHDLVADEENP
jgi:DNA-binding CsgD family transcriptional regulator